jgi:predicted SnoaL-like aldol condensation-catalyzing enzyme
MKEMYLLNGIAKRLGLLAFGFALAVSAKPVAADDVLAARNKEIVRNFYTTMLVGRDVDAAPRFLRADYIQHNPQVPTELKGFMDAFRERFAQKLPSDYKREPLNVVGENDMVVIYVRQTWTGKDGQHHQALGFDMFRVQDGYDRRALGRGLMLSNLAFIPLLRARLRPHSATGAGRFRLVQDRYLRGAG